MYKKVFLFMYGENACLVSLTFRVCRTFKWNVLRKPCRNISRAFIESSTLPCMHTFMTKTCIINTYMVQAYQMDSRLLAIFCATQLQCKHLVPEKTAAVVLSEVGDHSLPLTVHLCETIIYTGLPKAEVPQTIDRLP